LQGHCKGDASVCYVKTESVQLALDILDGSYLKKDVMIHVSKGKSVRRPLVPLFYCLLVRDVSSWLTLIVAVLVRLAAVFTKKDDSAVSKKAKVSAASRKVARAAAKQVGSQFHGHLREEGTFCMGTRAYSESVVAMAPCERGAESRQAANPLFMHMRALSPGVDMGGRG
jgi:hypothetical protein